jgi:hypothetical protein
MTDGLSAWQVYQQAQWNRTEFDRLEKYIAQDLGCFTTDPVAKRVVFAVQNTSAEVCGDPDSEGEWRKLLSQLSNVRLNVGTRTAIFNFLYRMAAGQEGVAKVEALERLCDTMAILQSAIFSTRQVMDSTKKLYAADTASTLDAAESLLCAVFSGLEGKPIVAGKYVDQAKSSLKLVKGYTE